MNTIIQTPTNQLENSLDFYRKLNFQVLSEAAPSLVSDGKVIIEINPNRFARTGVKLYQQSWEETVSKLSAITKVLPIENGYLLADPSGACIYLMEEEIEVPQPSETPAILGSFAGISLETTDIEQSIAIWKLLGFQHTMGAVEQGWIAFENAAKMTVSFMLPNSCPHLFFNPSLTYFNGGKNLPVIANIRAVGIPITEEITVFNKENIVDNVIIRDPGGLGFFVFND